jgi:hypothetical protein
MTVKAVATSRSLLTLLDLGRRARQTDDPAVLRFMAVNDSHSLATYRQAGLWLEGLGVQALSGVVQVEANAPYALWLNKLCRHLFDAHPRVAPIDARDLPDDMALEWGDWYPNYGLWLPFTADNDTDAKVAGGLLLVRDLPWTEPEKALLSEWLELWAHAWFTLHRATGLTWKHLVWNLFSVRKARRQLPWYRRRLTKWLAFTALVLSIPVRLSVMAPGELVPANPAVIRSPMEGVLFAFHVQPNQQVRSGDLLFGFDEVLIRSRLDVARFALATADAEYRQAAQQALSDPRSKAMLSTLTGKADEKRVEVNFLLEQLGRAQVTAPRDGIALFDDPSEWIGRPVAVGERIMRIAEPGNIEVEAWLPLADAIPLRDDAAVTLYLNSSPLDPVRATLRYLAHDAVERPDGSYAYRLRATLDASVDHRVGLKGTARATGRWVPVGYWVLRRPAAAVRAWIGW